MLTDEIAYERKTIPQAWSDGQKADLYRLRVIEGRDWSEIARHFGRSEAAVKSKFKYEQHENKIQRAAEPMREPVPDSVLAERTRRLTAAARDLAGALLGDPPRGYSALDRRTA